MENHPYIEDKYDRLEFLMKKSDKKIADIADFIGISRTHLWKLITEKKLSDDKIKYIYEFINIDTNKTNKTNGVNDLQIVTANKDEITQVRKSNGKGGLVPYFEVDFYAGNSTELLDSSITPAYYMDIPEFRGCTAFRAYSDSMENLIHSGNILFGKKIEDWQSHLEYGQIYGIVTKDSRRYLKYIRKAENHKDYFLLKSENPNYDDFDIPKDKIFSIWLIEGWLNKNT